MFSLFAVTSIVCPVSLHFVRWKECSGFTCIMLKKTRIFPLQVNDLLLKVFFFNIYACMSPVPLPSNSTLLVFSGCVVVGATEAKASVHLPFSSK